MSSEKVSCTSNIDPSSEPYINWQGSSLEFKFVCSGDPVMPSNPAVASLLESEWRSLGGGFKGETGSNQIALGWVWGPQYFLDSHRHLSILESILQFQENRFLNCPKKMWLTCRSRQGVFVPWECMLLCDKMRDLSHWKKTAKRLCEILGRSCVRCSGCRHREESAFPLEIKFCN